jgi:hypothetical protein
VLAAEGDEMGFLQNILSRLKKPQPTIRERSIFEQLIQAERDSAVWNRSKTTLVEPAGSLPPKEDSRNSQDDERK